MVKNPGRMGTWPAMVLLALLATSQICTPAADSNDQRVEELLQLQERAPDSIIRLDDASLRKFALQPEGRPYSLVVFFDALQLRDKTELKLEELRKEFGLAASAFVTHNKGTPAGSKVFFVELEFKQSPLSFSLFGVNALPSIRLVPPGKSGLKESQSLDAGEMGRAADGIAAFVESRTGHKVGEIQRPPLVTKQQMVVVAGGLLVAAPFVVKMLMAPNTPLHERELWCFGALLIYFFSVSGGMFNIIRGMPLFMPDRNNPGKLLFFYQQSGMQLGAEGFVVGFLYTVVGAILALVSHFLDRFKSRMVQRMVMVVGMTVCFWAVRAVIFLDNWKTGYKVHAFWPNRWS